MGENSIIRIFLICTCRLILLDDQIKEDAMGRTCSMNGRNEKRLQIVE